MDYELNEDIAFDDQIFTPNEPYSESTSVHNEINKENSTDSGFENKSRYIDSGLMLNLDCELGTSDHDSDSETSSEPESESENLYDELSIIPDEIDLDDLEADIISFNDPYSETLNNDKFTVILNSYQFFRIKDLNDKDSQHEPAGIIFRCQCLSMQSLQKLTNINLMGYKVVKTYPFTVLFKSEGDLWYVISSFYDTAYFRKRSESVCPWGTQSRFIFRKQKNNIWPSNFNTNDENQAKKNEQIKKKELNEKEFMKRFMNDKNEIFLEGLTINEKLVFNEHPFLKSEFKPDIDSITKIFRGSSFFKIAVDSRL